MPSKFFAELRFFEALPCASSSCAFASSADTDSRDWLRVCVSPVDGRFSRETCRLLAKPPPPPPPAGCGCGMHSITEPTELRLDDGNEAAALPIVKLE